MKSIQSRCQLQIPHFQCLTIVLNIHLHFGSCCKNTRMLVFSCSVFTCPHKFDDFKHPFNSSVTVDRRITGTLWQKSPDTRIVAPQNCFGCHQDISTFCSMTSYRPSTQMNNLHIWRIVAIALFLEIMQAGALLIYIFSGNFKAENAVCPLSNKVVAIPDETNAEATSWCHLIFAKINKNRSVFAVSSRASRRIKSTSYIVGSFHQLIVRSPLVLLEMRKICTKYFN